VTLKTLEHLTETAPEIRNALDRNVGIWRRHGLLWRDLGSLTATGSRDQNEHAPPSVYTSKGKGDLVPNSPENRHRRDGKAALSASVRLRRAATRKQAETPKLRRSAWRL
jgi:hypothetical protein